MRRLAIVLIAFALFTGAHRAQAETATKAGPSFDCAKATSSAELLVCSHPDLAAADRALAQAFRAALAGAPDKSALRKGQSEWLRGRRDACTDVECMLAAYAERSLVLAGATGAHTRTTAAVDVSAPDMATTGEAVPCYYGLCLKDPISRLNYPVTGLVRQVDAKVNAGAAERAGSVFIADGQLPRSLAAKGLLGGKYSIVDANQQTIDELKRVRTICEEGAAIVRAKVRTSNGKDTVVAYVPMTDSAGITTYGLISLAAPYPSVKSMDEKRELAKQALAAMNMQMSCGNNVGVGIQCNDQDSRYEMSVDGGELTLSLSRRDGVSGFFDLNRTRANPLCGSKVTF